MKVDTWLDERGHRCPLPVIALMRAAQQAPAGFVIAVLSDDPAARHDIPAWCRLKGHAYVGEEPPPVGDVGSSYIVEIRE